MLRYVRICSRATSSISVTTRGKARAAPTVARGAHHHNLLPRSSAGESAGDGIYSFSTTLGHRRANHRCDFRVLHLHKGKMSVSLEVQGLLFFLRRLESRRLPGKSSTSVGALFPWILRCSQHQDAGPLEIHCRWRSGHPCHWRPGVESPSMPDRDCAGDTPPPHESRQLLAEPQPSARCRPLPSTKERCRSLVDHVSRILPSARL